MGHHSSNFSVCLKTFIIKSGEKKDDACKTIRTVPATQWVSAGQRVREARGGREGSGRGRGEEGLQASPVPEEPLESKEPRDVEVLARPTLGRVWV